MDISDYICAGADNAVTREQLMAYTGLNDRNVRAAIEAARKQGAIILNAQDGRGYYTSDNLDDLMRQYRANKHRAMSILVQQRYLRQRIKELGGKLP